MQEVPRGLVRTFREAVQGGGKRGRNQTQDTLVRIQLLKEVFETQLNQVVVPSRRTDIEHTRSISSDCCSDYLARKVSCLLVVKRK